MQLALALRQAAQLVFAFRASSTATSQSAMALAGPALASNASTVPVFTFQPPFVMLGTFVSSAELTSHRPS